MCVTNKKEPRTECTHAVSGEYTGRILRLLREYTPCAALLRAHAIALDAGAGRLSCSVTHPAFVLRYAMMEGADDIPITIRSFVAKDLGACQTLYKEGLLGSTKIADNDTGFDIDDIESAYMRKQGNAFFVAEGPAGDVLGMIGVQNHEEATGEIRRLRVRRDSQRRGIGTRLVESALKFCQEHHYLKVTLDTYMDHEPAIRLFEKFRFRHSRSRTVGGKELRYFYLDLYAGEPPKP